MLGRASHRVPRRYIHNTTPSIVSHRAINASQTTNCLSQCRRKPKRPHPPVAVAVALHAPLHQRPLHPPPSPPPPRRLRSAGARPRLMQPMQPSNHPRSAGALREPMSRKRLSQSPHPPSALVAHAPKLLPSKKPLRPKLEAALANPMPSPPLRPLRLPSAVAVLPRRLPPLPARHVSSRQLLA
jgi:hypothetical protein